MKVLITGSQGQLGYELQRTKPSHVELLCTDYQDLDIADKTAVTAYFAAEKPELVINAAAYTAVDKAESEHELADQVNHLGAKNLAEAAQAIQSAFVQVSTDFIFDGTGHKPYTPDAIANPISVYGATKLAGEKAVQAAHNNAIIIRTAWVYSAHGNNFVKTMLRLMNERTELGVIADQIGSPTWANGLATCCWTLAAQQANGIYHWTDAGVASWYDFAVAIYRYGKRFDLINNDVLIKPITTADYPTPAARPSYSVIDKTNTWKTTQLPAQHWEFQLRQMLKELVDG